MKIRQQLLDKIERGEIKMKPRWEFVLIERALRVALGLFIVLATATIVELIIFIYDYNPVELWQYGEVGKELFYEDFPYWILLGGIISLIISTQARLNVGTNYRKSKEEIWFTNLLIIMLMVISMMIGRYLF